MQTNSHEELGSQKTLGPQAARLLAVLHEKRRTIFTVGDVQEVTGLGPKSTRNFVGKLVRRGVATRLKPGLFILVPFELGREREYLGNPYLVARALAGGRDYYLSHASAIRAGQCAQRIPAKARLLPVLVTYGSPRCMRI